MSSICNTSNMSNISNTSNMSNINNMGNISNIGNLHSPLDMNLLAMSKATVIFKCAVISAISIFGFFGNVLTLIAIRTTTVLRTKSNRLIAALSAWELVLQGPVQVCFNTYQILAFVVSDQPCRYRSIVAVITPIQKLPFYACDTLFLAIAVDRYIAVVYPLHYESVVTEARMNCAIAGCSLFVIGVLVVQLSWMVTINWSTCDLPYSLTMNFVFDYFFYVSVAAVMSLVYGRILIIALQHRRKIIDQSHVCRLREQPSCGISTVELSTVTAQETQPRTGRAKSIKGEFKAARMTALVIGSYTLFWLSYFIGKGLQLSGYRAQYVQSLTDVGTALGTVSVSIDWIIYGLTNRNFRKAYMKILSKGYKSISERLTVAG